MRQATLVLVMMVALGLGGWVAAPESVLAAGTPSQAGRPVTLTEAGRTVHGLLWGTGTYGVVLSHGAIYDAQSWSDLAIAIAAEDMVALAVEETAPADLQTANAYLRRQQGVTGVALIGASAGGASAIQAVAQAPRAWDQLILLSATGAADSLGTLPKLVIASAGEGLAEAARQMVASAQGDDNQVLIVPGSAHAQAIFRTPAGPQVTRAILDRLTRRAHG